jgi:hypothetical protein
MTTETRQPPQVIMVPMSSGPTALRRRNADIVLDAACLFFFAVGVVTSLIQASGAYLCVAVLTALVGIMTIVVLVGRRRAIQEEAYRKAAVDGSPSDAPEPRASALDLAWKYANRVPKVKDVRAALAETFGEDYYRRACILCYGEPDVPEVGELHLEPEIITPTGAICRSLVLPLLAVALAVWWLLNAVGLLPWLPGRATSEWTLASFLVVGLPVLCMWIWRGMIRPTYYRLAPGVIQVIVYSLSNRRPIIRSYPMEPGTLAVFTRIRKHLILTLARGENTDMLSFSRMDRPQERIEQAWKALLSTAPTPPLCDEALVG